ncbi:sulfotransferase domain-containing protein [Paenibacillus planticolens]|uniref:sulfotransferase domain-containing protein n=1 Tax=Paenibacillus planticolens TaxID=2654976 RepID=UPI0014925588|nr:sulfotransferase domain-containing protein [Paenibacillus planticolens]
MNQLLLGIPGSKMNEYVFYEGLVKDLAAHASILSRALPNELFMGHVYYSPEWATLLGRLGIKTIFMSRDLRDVLVSLTYFIIEKLPDYPLYEKLIALSSQKERYLLLINGIGDYPNIKNWFGVFHGWLSEPGVLNVTYEELMTSPETRRRTITAIAQFLWKDSKPPMPFSELVRSMEGNMDSDRSFTFRKGIIGGWRKEFDDEVIAAFKRVAGDVLIQTGYEKDLDWS